MIQQKVKIVSNQRVGPGYFKLKFACREIARCVLPGQFVMVRVSDGFTPLLRRPFGVHSTSGGKIEILYEMVGKGTQALAEKKSGEALDVLGPLGNGFDYRFPVFPFSRLPVLVAGGMGVAPLFFLAQKLSSIKHRASSIEALGSRIKIQVLIGVKTKNAVLCENEFKRLGYEVKVATDDGSRGFKGYVSDLLKSILRNTQYAVRNAEIYACGPRPMLKEIKKICLQKNIPGQASLEEHMACGIGACMGCAAKTVDDGFKRVCKEGPVFDIAEVIF